MKIKGDLLKFFDAWPPFLLYALARRARKGNKGKRIFLSHQEISILSGLPARSVTRIAAKITWRGEKLEKIAAFARGCNFDFSNLKRQIKSLRLNSRTKSKRFFHLPPNDPNATYRWKTYLRKCDEYLQAHKNDQ